MKSILLTGTDIGNPARQGAIEQLANGYRITAGGADIWSKSDEFRRFILLITHRCPRNSRLAIRKHGCGLSVREISFKLGIALKVANGGCLRRKH